MLDKLAKLPGFLRHLARVAKIEAGRQWVHYSVLQSVVGAGYYVDPTALLHRDVISRITLGRGVHVGPYSYACALEGSHLDLGEDVYVNEFNNIRAAGGDIFIGDRTIIAQYVSIIASNHKIPPRNQPIRDAGNDVARSGVRIGRDVWIAANVVILPGVEIGDGAVIGAGSIVSRSIPAYAVATGNPARVKRLR